mmetsp:Transcript_29472/g.46849  ORF Transcript_29472/g.46849 Transcript_29472/m.46849 type:complete len:279 (-) Transcript_29472:1426-2262(-)
MHRKQNRMNTNKPPTKIINVNHSLSENKNKPKTTKTTNTTFSPPPRWFALCAAHEAVVLVVDSTCHILQVFILLLLEQLVLLILVQGGLIHGELDGIGCGLGAEIVHSRLESVFPAIKMHGSELTKIRVLHMDVKRLRLIDEVSAIDGHIDELLLRDLPHRLIDLLELRRDLVQSLHTAVGRNQLVLQQRRPHSQLDEIAQQMVIDAHKLSRQCPPHIHIRRVRLKTLVVAQDLRSGRRRHRSHQQRITNAVFCHLLLQRGPIKQIGAQLDAARLLLR